MQSPSSQATPCQTSEKTFIQRKGGSPCRQGIHRARHRHECVCNDVDLMRLRCGEIDAVGAVRCDAMRSRGEGQRCEATMRQCGYKSRRSPNERLPFIRLEPVQDNKKGIRFPFMAVYDIVSRTRCRRPANHMTVPRIA